MVAVTQTENFGKWLRGLRDDRTVAKIAARIRRLQLGNPGDVTPVGSGISELRIDFGPGYRIYFARMGEGYVILLGGDKSTQGQDIRKAKQLLSELED